MCQWDFKWGGSCVSVFLNHVKLNNKTATCFYIIKRYKRDVNLTTNKFLEMHVNIYFVHLEFFVDRFVDLLLVYASEGPQDGYSPFRLSLRQKPPICNQQQQDGHDWIIRSTSSYEQLHKNIYARIRNTDRKDGSRLTFQPAASNAHECRHTLRSL